jgi:transcriptional regulator with XRE-family HTH domain
MSLGANIRKARKARGWTQKELAERVESDASYMNRIETGKANPSIAVLARIAEALEVSLDELVKGQPDGAEVHIQDAGLLERMRLIDSLDEDDRGALVHMIDTMLTKKRMRELLDTAATHGPR